MSSNIMPVSNTLVSNMPKLAAVKTYLSVKEPARKKIEILMEDLKKFHEGTLEVETTKEQGDLLENILIEIFKNIHVFNYVANERTSTNEMDLLIKLKSEGKMLRSKDAGEIIPKWFPDYLITL